MQIARYVCMYERACQGAGEKRVERQMTAENEQKLRVREHERENNSRRVRGRRQGGLLVAFGFGFITFLSVSLG